MNGALSGSSQSRIVVRAAERVDADALLSLIEALALFEKLAPPDAAARARLVADAWPTPGRRQRIEPWLAEIISDGIATPVGYALTLETYSSFLALPTLYLEDIFILPEHRRRSVGKAMMNRLVKEAIQRGCGRMEWVVLDWNTGAQEFYQRLGGRHLDDWQYFRLSREDMPAALERTHSD